MYNGVYSKANLSPASTRIHKAKSKSCGYYMKIVFFFSSLIQSLIIVSLVLFVVYGQPQDTVTEQRLKDLEQSFSKLSIENIQLQAQKKNLSQVLNVTLIAKQTCERNRTDLRRLLNTSSATIKSIFERLSQCPRVPLLMPCRPTPCACADTKCPQLKFSQDLLQHVKNNFTETVRIMQIDFETCKKERNQYHLEAIELRRDKALSEEKIKLYGKKCKEDFAASFQGMTAVTSAFLIKIDTLFPKIFPFKLTCEKQRDQLDEIRNNCSSLSREMEDKLQKYLDSLATQVESTARLQSNYEIQNKRLTEDIQMCKGNRTAMAEQNAKVLQEIQVKHDEKVQQLLLEGKKLNEAKQLSDSLLKLKEDEIKQLSNTIDHLNNTLGICKLLRGSSSYSAGASNPLNLPYKSISKGSLNIVSGPTGAGTSGVNTLTFGRPDLGNPAVGPGSLGHNSPLFTDTSKTPLVPGLTGNLGPNGVGPGILGLGASVNGVAGPGMTGLGRTGVNQGSTASGGSVTGMGPPSFGGGRTTSAQDTMFTAQITQHLRELHQFLKPE
ncbi:plasmalemma vesicle associated protein a isoform X3 [Chanos chanos]|uniref:Plasmalemma vesicle associated protein a isoform X3 n=1 Tax=Chanos chanos TaxID=29144 RepID=A0A6J2VCN0_CHACN|nr:plasmalemma vesicle-associated protein-like isoform X3 [Chanos chanos]